MELIMKQNLNKRTLELESKEDNKFDSKKKWKNKSRKKGSRNPFKGVMSNPVDVHLKNSAIVKDLCSIPFNIMAGFKVALNQARTIFTQLGYVKTVYYDWFAGISDDFRSFLNTASTNRWTYVRSRNSGATNYQASDLFINTLFACCDVIFNLEYVRRIFGMKDVYSVFNRLTPRVLFNAMGIDYDDFIQNVANYRGRYNIIAAKASALVVPKMGFIDYGLSFFSKIFKDRDSTTGREQLYVVVKPFHHIYDATFDSNGGAVRLLQVADMGITPATAGDVYTTPSTLTGLNVRRKLSVLLDIIDKQLDAIITDEDCNIMFGDMIKAYGDTGNFYKPTVLTEDYSVVPEYSEEFLQQHHNSRRLRTPAFTMNAAGTITYTAATEYKNVIKQDGNGYIITDFHINKNNFISGVDCILDSNKEIPTPEEVMLMTRWINCYKTDTSNVDTILGPALIFDGAVYIGDVASGQIVSIPDIQELGYTTDAGAIGTYWNLISKSSNFDWDAIKLLEMPTAGAPQVVGDINNIKPVPKETIRQIHDVDFASLYDIPFSGSF